MKLPFFPFPFPISEPIPQALLLSVTTCSQPWHGQHSRHEALKGEQGWSPPDGPKGWQLPKPTGNEWEKGSGSGPCCKALSPTLDAATRGPTKGASHEYASSPAPAISAGSWHQPFGPHTAIRTRPDRLTLLEKGFLHMLEKWQITFRKKNKNLGVQKGKGEEERIHNLHDLTDFRV